MAYIITMDNGATNEDKTVTGRLRSPSCRDSGGWVDEQTLEGTFIYDVCLDRGKIPQICRQTVPEVYNSKQVTHNST